MISLKTTSAPVTNLLDQGFTQGTQSVLVPIQDPFYAASLSRHTEDWLQISQDPFIMQAISGVKIPVTVTPPTRYPTQEELDFRKDDPVLEKAVSDLLALGAVSEVTAHSEAFISRVFTVPKRERGVEYGRRFILNLKVSHRLSPPYEPYK